MNYNSDCQNTNGSPNELDTLISLPITSDKIKTLLTATGDLQEALFSKARSIRREAKIDYCLFRGVIEVSNYCQKKCSYCAMHAGNKSIHRYRMNAQEIVDVAQTIFDSGISVIFIQSGQDPKIDPILEEAIPAIKEKFGCSILLCIGEKKPEVYQRLYSLGADSFILKFETSDPVLYENTTQSDHGRRMQCLDDLRTIGYKIGVGNIIGLENQTLDSIVKDIELSLALDPNFVSSSPFIPNQGTLLEHLPYGDFNLTLNCMAIYRILMPTCMVPTVSALEKIQKGGQLMGLNAGANVMTINFTPPSYREKYSIYSKKRFIVSLDHAIKTAEDANLSAVLNR